MNNSSAEARNIEASKENTASMLWIALVAIGSVLGSLAFACAAPLAAIASVAALKMRLREGLALVGVAWLANQLVGFLVLDFPQTLDTVAWGAAIGIASLLATAAARSAVRLRVPASAGTLVALLAAVAMYEASLYSAATVLPSSADDYSLAVITHVLLVNAVAFVALLVAHRGAIALRIVSPFESEGTAAI